MYRLTQACMDWVQVIFGTSVIKKKQTVWPVFSDYLSGFYDYGKMNSLNYYFQYDDYETFHLFLYIELNEPASLMKEKGRC